MKTAKTALKRLLSTKEEPGDLVDSEDTREGFSTDMEDIQLNVPFKMFFVLEAGENNRHDTYS